MIGLRHKGKYPIVIQEEFEYLILRLRTILTKVITPDGEFVPTAGELALVPIGTVVDYAGATIPTGWLLCDGSAVLRAQYRDLFSAIGTTHGAGDGDTTFNLPEARQRFTLGKAVSGTGSTLGGTGGAIDHTHGLTAVTSGAPSATTNVTAGAVAVGDGTHTHDTTGNTDAANPPFIAFNKIIYTGVK